MAIYVNRATPEVAIVAISAHGETFEQRHMPSLLRNFHMPAEKLGHYIVRLRVLAGLQGLILLVTLWMFFVGPAGLAHRWVPSAFADNPDDAIVRVFMPVIFGSIAVVFAVLPWRGRIARAEDLPASLIRVEGPSRLFHGIMAASFGTAAIASALAAVSQESSITILWIGIAAAVFGSLFHLKRATSI
jgi:hypothetical protein